MWRPARRQWVVLWIGAVSLLLTLAIAGEYVLRGVVGVAVVTALSVWQLGSSQTESTRPTRDPLVASNPDAPGISQGPSGVGGWLSLFIFGTIVGGPLLLLSQATARAAQIEDPIAAWIELLAYGALGAWSMYVGFGLLYLWPNAHIRGLWYTGVLTTLSFVGAFVGAPAQGRNAAEQAGFQFGYAFSSSLPALGWAIYLARSKRVGNTYPQLTGGVYPKRRRAVVVGCVYGFVVIALGTGVYRQTEQRIEAQFDSIDPYQWVRVGAESSGGFLDGYSDKLLGQIRTNIPNSTIRPSGPATFFDLGVAMRGTLRYKAEIGTDAKSVAVIDGAAHFYFHPDGVVLVESGCAPDVLKCEAMQELEEAAERALLSRLKGSQLSGILPEGNCSTENVESDGTIVKILTCTYSDSEAASLSIVRTDLQSARKGFRAAGISKKMRREFVGLVFRAK